MTQFREDVHETPHLWKADVNSAFRRVPLKPSHSWAAGVAFMHGGRTWISFHYACPFGAVSSTHNWERVGDLICSIAKNILGLPMHRYVDDYFACDRQGLCIACWLVRARAGRVILAGQSAPNTP
jgi:hypothetical protein